jgi:hypothetical protein
VEFQAVTASVTTCSSLYKASAAIAGTAGVLTAGVVPVTATVLRINSSRIAVTVPSGLALPTGFTTAKFLMCVYDTNSTTASNLLATANYSIAAKPTITNITPTAGPALGGYTISVSGTGFTSGTTATLGNVPISDATVNSTGTLLTGTAPARPAGSNISLVITTLGGTVSSHDPNQDGVYTDATDFTLYNGLVVTPNTAPSGTTPNLDVQGVGFSGMTLSDTTASPLGVAGSTGTVNTDFAADSVTTTAHIVLVSKSSGYAAAAGASGTRPVTLCMNPLVLSDTELLCTLDLTESLDPTLADTTGSNVDVPNGAYNLQIIQTGAAAATSTQYAATTITSGSTFTVSPY